MHTLSHFLAEVIYTTEFKIFLSFKKVTTSRFEDFRQKEIFFNVILIINTFLSK